MNAPERVVSFQARAHAPEDAIEPLRSPASGAACVYWRLRVVEEVHPRLHLVHEVTSPDAFELEPSSGDGDDGDDGGGSGEEGGGGQTGERIRVAPDGARIQATPALHRPGSAAAEAAARALGLSGRVSVEEITLRAGDRVTAEGVLEDPGAGASPFRRVSRQLELYEATVRLPSRTGLGSALVLPLAIGTAAALLGSAGAAVWAAWHFDLLPQGFDEPVVLPAELGPQRLPHPRMP